MSILKVFVNSKELGSLTLKQDEEYFIGRHQDCDITIRDTTLSRKHLKIYFDQHWKVDCLSKFGDLEYNGASSKNLDLNEDITFYFSNYEVRFLFSDSEKNLEDSEESLSFEIEEDRQEIESEEIIEPQNLDDEDTNVEHNLATPVLTIQKSGQEQKVDLENKEEWLLGRSEKCDVYIDDTKSSRKHCQIIKNHNKFFVSDLGSSNGTYLNKQRMKSKKIAPLNSGDTIQIGRTKILFELVNKDLQKQLSTLPAPVNRLIVTQENGQPTSKGLQLRQQNQLEKPGAVKIFKGPNSKQKYNKKFIAIATAFLLVFAYLLKDKSSSPSKNVKLNSKEEVKSPFEKLSKQNQNLVLQFYDSAYRFYIQGDYKKALNETRKIHRLLPERGYLDLSVEKDSKQLEQLAKTAIRLQEQKKEIQRRQQQQKELLAEIDRLVNICDRQAVPGTSIEQAQKCLSKVYELDPENKKAEAILNRLELQADQRRSRQAQQAYYAGQVSKGKSLFQRAKQLEKQDKILDAIGAYKRHIASTYPDPQNLKTQSKNKAKLLSLELRKRVDALVKQAETEYEAKNYKIAIKKLNTALKLDPSVESAKNLLNMVTKELNKNMKTIYSDSVLEESLGNVETAKSLWKKIINTDVESGNYYQKAQSKLKKYGG